MADLVGRHALVTGAGGFIGGHLVRNLLRRGCASVRAVDKKPLNQWYQVHPESDNRVLDLTSIDHCRTVSLGIDDVFNLAADMGGMGFIQGNRAACMLNVLISTHMCMAAREQGVQRLFYASSACVYNEDKQRDARVTPLRESDAYPAQPEDGYGWEKLFSERMCRHFEEDFGIAMRVARFHNIYGPHGTFDGGREKAPAAICRKVIEAELSGQHQIEIWGDGEQTRSFTYIDDCLLGILLIHGSEDLGPTPLNLGSSELVTINQLVDIVEGIAGIKLERNYKLDAPIGVNGRNSDNTLFHSHFGWQPDTRLVDGMQRTYSWIKEQILSGLAPAPALPESTPWHASSSSTNTTGQSTPVPDSI